MVDEKLLRDAGLQEEKIQRLKAAWDELESIKARPQRQIPCVVCAGIYNAGKSTLLNALTEQTDYFPTGNIPTTKEIKRLEYYGAMYIDTPGLNADEGDDRETVKAYEDADYILFVSSAQDGGISQTESGWLRRMRARYTREGFQRRLIYALSQCDQVEDDDFPAIRNQFAGDLEKSLGFAPEPIFRVDSATYEDGKAQNETLLIDHSGIPQLRAYLAEKVADAQELREAERAELDTRRREVVGILADLYQQCKSAREKAVQDTQAKLTEVDKAWNAFEAELQKAIPTEEISPISGSYFSFDCDASDSVVEGRSRSEVSRRARDLVRCYYDKQQRVADEWAEEAVSSYETPRRYFSNGLNSAYFTACNAVNSAFSSGILALRGAGLRVSVPSEISVEVDLPYDLEAELKRTITKDILPGASGAFNYNYYADRYCDYPRQSTEYVSGLFGGMREVTIYRADIESAVIKMREKLRDRLDSRTEKANRLINRYWSRFREQLIKEVESRKAELKRQADSYQEQLRQDAGETSVISALSYLDTLAKEAQA